MFPHEVDLDRFTSKGRLQLPPFVLTDWTLTASALRCSEQPVMRRRKCEPAYDLAGLDLLSLNCFRSLEIRRYASADIAWRTSLCRCVNVHVIAIPSLGVRGPRHAVGFSLGDAVAAAETLSGLSQSSADGCERFAGGTGREKDERF